MKKITIIGNGGAGKSSLAKALGKQLKLPVYHLDQIIWLPNWEAISESEFCSKHQSLIAGDSWIIEGLGYDSSIESRFLASNTIIYIDFSIVTHMLWAIKRSIKSFYTMPNGWAKDCQTVTKLPYIMRIIWHVHKYTRPYILSILKKYEKTKVIHYIRSPKELNGFYKKIETVSN
ncbi:hypothetical protein [Spartinivicinus poritis]|uniref:Adenylate kinase n=1 Tax=Spartinivicinus poritis TaxID=2994640 RepID=A0ABT5UE42_9GAMM|nr:hypothetical protein [Spartinivicinus sp. A2-2]MDE1464650.1 hypothetical protein [Spartinivicinus sp. A2-2]